ncbi:MAG TPA: hypothetical protein VLS45_06095, partial [Methylomicrobium sp.]|nr:hypothetical protein [Methylomicrobium sp.]
MDDELSPTDGSRERKAVGREEPGPTQFPSAAILGTMEAGTVRKEIVHIPPKEAVGTREAGGRVECVTTGAQLRGSSQWKPSTGALHQPPVTVRGEPFEDSGLGADARTTAPRSHHPQHDFEEEASLRFYTPPEQMFTFPASTSTGSNIYYTAPRLSSPASTTDLGAGAGSSSRALSGPIPMQPFSTGPRTTTTQFGQLIPIIEADNAGMFYDAPPASYRRSPSPLSWLRQLQEGAQRSSPPASRRRSPSPPASQHRRLEETSSTSAGFHRSSPPPAVNVPGQASRPDWLASPSPPASYHRPWEEASSTSAGSRRSPLPEAVDVPGQASGPDRLPSTSLQTVLSRQSSHIGSGQTASIGRPEGSKGNWDVTKAPGMVWDPEDGGRSRPASSPASRRRQGEVSSTAAGFHRPES